MENAVEQGLTLRVLMSGPAPEQEQESNEHGIRNRDEDDKEVKGDAGGKVLSPGISHFLAGSLGSCCGTSCVTMISMAGTCRPRPSERGVDGFGSGWFRDWLLLFAQERPTKQKIVVPLLPF